MTKRILVTGGAGYIGSHIVKKLVQRNFDVVVFDNLATGHRWAVPDQHLVVGDLREQNDVSRLFKENDFSAVIHLAASSLVGESVQNPLFYYMNNVVGTLNLVHACIEFGIDNLVFSSSAAVYGEPEKTPIHESTPLAPINPYGATKATSERLLADVSATGALRYVALRYFNAAGADPEGRIGECHEPETHLIPRLLQAISGRSEPFTLYGEDYPTSDGTCVRDYIHVEDLARAHVLALEYLHHGGASKELNCGYGHGYSVNEVIEAARRVTGREVPMTVGPRRSGDPPRLVAAADPLRNVLGWRPHYDDLDKIVSDAWQWEQLLNHATQ